MKIPICQRVFQYFCHFFIFSGTYPKQRGANAVFCAFWHDKGGDIYPVSTQTPRFRAQIPISRLGSPYKVKTKASLKEKNEKHALYPVSAGTGFTPATHLYAGVQTMRARICSVFSCDMFARVVWLKLRRITKLPSFALPLAARTRHAWLVRLTRARGELTNARSALVGVAETGG